MSATAAFGYAPAKVILLGEHAVVYGAAALAATLDRGIRAAVSVYDGDDGPVLRGKGFGIDAVARPNPGGEGPEALRMALARLIELFGERVRQLSLVVEGQMPAGSGLGSSAALSVAVVRGVHRYFEEEVSPEQEEREALALEKVFHGNPSGVDHSVVLRGAPIFFRKGEGDAPNVVEAVPVPRRIQLAIGFAGHHAGTSHAVGALRDRMKRHPDAYAHIMRGIGALAEEARDCLANGQLSALGELMNLNQGYLNALGVSTPEIERLCAIARERDAMGAKLTGAGGGGAVIALCDGDPNVVVRGFEEAGYEGFATEIGRGPDAPTAGAPAATPPSA